MEYELPTMELVCQVHLDQILQLQMFIIADLYY